MIEFINCTPDDSACPELVDRLYARDPTLWSADTDVQRSIRSRLGWLDAAAFMDANAPRITEFADRVRSEGYQHAVLLGMGGSSLAPEVYAALFDHGAFTLTIADSTAPRHVAAITEACQAASTLFIVSSKSGTTAETSALEAHFFDWACSRCDAPQDRFVAITDPGSPLQELAAERGYRDTFVNPANIGGRFSALSFFGLVPAALVGVDLAALRAQLPDPAADSSPVRDACRLGLSLGSLARSGRNKLTLQFSPSLAPLAAWIEQLIDESTGKDGTGIVVVPREPRYAPEDYTGDRVFAVVEIAGEDVDGAWLDTLSAAGHPVMRWRLPGLDRLGAEFFRWEVATAAAGRVLGVNPFDEPDVNDSKARTREFLAHSGAAGTMTPQPIGALKDLLANVRPGDYLAILAYLPPSPGTDDRLRRWSERLSRMTGLPCCVGYGPRYLHSSGQLHKGGPDQGVFILLTLASEFDLPIPGQPHGFRSLIDAQARGDLQVLRDRGRRVVHLQVAGVTGLDAVIRAFPGRA